MCMFYNGGQYSRNMCQAIHDQPGKTIFAKKWLHDPAGCYPGLECCIPHPVVCMFQFSAGNGLLTEIFKDQFRSYFGAVYRHGHTVATQGMYHSRRITTHQHMTFHGGLIGKRNLADRQGMLKYRNSIFENPF